MTAKAGLSSSGLSWVALDEAMQSASPFSAARIIAGVPL